METCKLILYVFIQIQSPVHQLTSILDFLVTIYSFLVFGGAGGAGGCRCSLSRDSTHDFNTQSGGALRLPFLDSERRSESIFGIQSAPPLSSYIWCWKRAPLSTHIWHSERPSPRFQAIYGVESVPPPLSTHIWHSERPPAFKLYMVLRACPAFNPYLAFRAPPAFKLFLILEA